jgi:hypothetical protein
MCPCVHVYNDLSDRLNNLEWFSLWLFHVSPCVCMCPMIWDTIIFLDKKSFFQSMCPHVSMWLHVSNDLRHNFFYGKIQKKFCACVHVSNDLRDSLNNLEWFSLWLFHVSPCVHVSSYVQWLETQLFFGIRKAFFKACVHMCPCVWMCPIIWDTTFLCDKTNFF